MSISFKISVSGKLFFNKKRLRALILPEQGAVPKAIAERISYMPVAYLDTILPLQVSKSLDKRYEIRIEAGFGTALSERGDSPAWLFPVADKLLTSPRVNYNDSRDAHRRVN
jgi:hypothetical protein